MTNNNRPRDITAYVMTEDAVNGPFDRYALVVRPDGEMRMVHYEGVAYLVTEEKPWRWNDFGNCEVFPPHALLALKPKAQEVNLADWVKVFGARCENNFSLIRQWYFNR